MIADLLYRLRALFRRGSVERDLDDELRFHLEQQTRKHVRAGMALEEAIRKTRIEWGGVSQVKEECRESWGVALLTALRQDTTYALRMLRKSPGFTATAVLSLALGIGANTTIFSIINGTLLGELPFQDSDRVVMLWNVAVAKPAAGRSYLVTVRNYLEWKEQATSFSEMGGWYSYGSKLGADQNGDHVERIRAQAFSASMWDVAGVKPWLGRVFTQEEDRAGQPAPVLVVSFDFWKRHFGGKPNAVGQRIEVDSKDLTIIGVMPQGFRFADNVDFWTPLGLTPEQMGSNDGYVIVAARLKDGVPLRRAQAEMESIGANLRKAFPKENRGLTVRVETVQEALFFRLEEPLFILQAAVAFVLLIACANVASLLMARATARRAEVAARTALGAGAGRIIRQMLTESALLSAGGAVLGLGIAWAGLRLIQATLPPDNLPSGAFALDASVLAFTTVVSVGTGLLFGLFPALKTVEFDLSTAFKQSEGASTGGAGHQHVLGSLVTAQFALAVVLLAGGGLMGKSFIAVMSNDLGVDPTHLLTFELNFEEVDAAGAAADLVYQRVYERMQTVPGVQSAAALSSAPLNGNVLRVGFKLLGRAAAGTKAAYYATTPGYFSTMKIAILRGRDFAASDSAAARPVIVINKTMADRWFPNQDPLGQSIVLDYAPDEQPRTIIGVAGDTLGRRIQRGPEPTVFVPHLQQPGRWPISGLSVRSRMVFIMRTAGEPNSIIPAVRSALAEIQPNRPADNVRNVEQFLDQQVGQVRAFVLLLVVFGIAAAILAGVGIYGVMAYAVSQRTREIGVRIALGATGANVMRLVSRQTLRLIITGMLLGLVAAALLTPILTSYLWTISPFDPATYASVAAALVVVALTACLVPARRAARVDPVIALRGE